MENIDQIIEDINDQTDIIYEGLHDDEVSEVIEAINKLRGILTYIENEIN